MAEEQNQVRAEQRLRHLNVLKVLQGSKDVQIDLTDDMHVSAAKLSGTAADLSQIIVEGLNTPLGTVPHATLRGENIVAIEVALTSNQVDAPNSNPVLRSTVGALTVPTPAAVIRSQVTAFSHAMAACFLDCTPVLLRAHPRRARPRAVCAIRGADVDVAVVGGGVGGLAAAAALHRAGRAPVVFERAAGGGGEGQALGLWTNGWRALDALGAPLGGLRAGASVRAALVVRPDGRPLGRARVARHAGRPAEFRYVMRADLLAALRAAAPRGCVQAGDAVAAVRARRGPFEVELGSGERVRAGAVVGADGVRSAVRRALRLPMQARYAGYRAYRGSATATPAIAAKLPARTVFQVWGAGERFGATILDDRRVHWYFTRAESTAQVEADTRSKEEQLAFVRARFAAWGNPVPIAVARGPQPDFAVTRCGDRLMMRSAWGQGACTLVGDAAHLSTPNLGQGAALALEDAVELGFQVGLAGGEAASAEDMERSMRKYERRRWVRNLEVAVRSRAVGVLVHVDNAALVWARNNVITPIVMNEAVLLGTTGWQPPTR